MMVIDTTLLLAKYHRTQRHNVPRFKKIFVEMRCLSKSYSFDVSQFSCIRCSLANRAGLLWRTLGLRFHLRVLLLSTGQLLPTKVWASFNALVGAGELYRADEAFLHPQESVKLTSRFGSRFPCKTAWTHFKPTKPRHQTKLTDPDPFWNAGSQLESFDVPSEAVDLSNLSLSSQLWYRSLTSFNDFQQQNSNFFEMNMMKLVELAEVGLVA